MAAKFDQVQKHLTLTGHVYSPCIFLMNKASFDKLSAADKQHFLDAAKEAVKANRARVDEDDAKGVAELRSKGMSVVENARQGQVPGRADAGVRPVRTAVRQGQHRPHQELQVSAQVRATLFLKVERGTTALATALACAMLATAAALGLWQIITRFVIEQPAEWTEVLIRFSLIWMVFLGIPLAFRIGAMVSVDVLYRWSGQRWRRVLDTMVALAALLLLSASPSCRLGLRAARPRADRHRAGRGLDVLGLPGHAGGGPVLGAGRRRQLARPAAPGTGDRVMTTTMLVTMVLCFALSISVAVSIGLAALVGIHVGQVNILIAVKEMFSSINKFPLAAIPFFILAGNLMETGGISRRLVEFAKSLVGGVQGGLPMTCVLTCMIFAAVSGSSVATTFAIGAILIPALIKHGYPTP